MRASELGHSSIHDLDDFTSAYDPFLIVDMLFLVVRSASASHSTKLNGPFRLERGRGRLAQLTVHAQYASESGVLRTVVQLKVHLCHHFAPRPDERPSNSPRPAAAHFGRYDALQSSAHQDEAQAGVKSNLMYAHDVILVQPAPLFNLTLIGILWRISDVPECNVERVRGSDSSELSLRNLRSASAVLCISPRKARTPCLRCRARDEAMGSLAA